MRCESGTGPLHNGPQCKNEARWHREHHNPICPRYVCDEHKGEFTSHFDEASGKWIPGAWEPLERQEELI